jgi:farnesyl-diphosphate farnesyltransferase
LELVFRNPDVLKRNVKITKGDACKIMFECTQNLFTVCEVFKRYTRIIAKKNDPRDPNFLAISAQCAKIEQFIETLFPKQDPKKLTLAQNQAQNKEPTMDGGEALVLFGVVIAALVCISGIMLGTAWFFGARFDHIFREASVFLPSREKATPMITGHEEL